MSVDHIPDSLAFTKLEGAGNDFVMLHEGWQAHGIALPELARRLCDRHLGVGGDGLLTIEPADAGGGADSDAGGGGDHLVMGFLNPDGSEAGMCGNGARCLAHHAWTLGFPEPLRFRKGDARYVAHRVDGPESGPRHDRNGAHSGGSWIRIAFPGIVDLQTVTLMKADGSPVVATSCRPGTEHMVVLASQLEEHARKHHEPDGGTEPAASLLGMDAGDDNAQDRRRRLMDAAGWLRRLRDPHPNGANVNLIRGIDHSTIENLTFERGVEGFTLSCGTGAIAAALAWHHGGSGGGPSDNGFSGDGMREESDSIWIRELSIWILVRTDGGMLRVGFRPIGGSRYTDICLDGPARTVFQGTFVMQP